jgi:hypothetical protein
MQITPIGWLLIPLGVLLAVIRPRWLYLLTVFLLPFTATAVINVGTGQNASGLQASMYLGSLLLARYCFTLLGAAYLPLPRAGKGGIAWLALFVAVAAISLVMPVWIDGRVQVPTPHLLDLSTQPLRLKSNNVIGVLYVAFGFLYAYLTVVWNRTPAMLLRTLKAFLAGSAFAAGWGVIELACKSAGVPYPAMIFNTSANPSAAGYRETLTEGVYRLSSVAVEPSIFAQALLVALALYLPFILGPKPLFGRAADRTMFALMLTILFLTTSSTAYLGMIVVLLLALSLLVVRGVLRLRHVVIPIAGISVAALIYALSPLVQQVVESALLSKGGGYSALERLKTISDSYQMFLKYPLLGIGWASITSHDLIVNILANSGVLGLAAFAVAMFCIFRTLYQSMRSRKATLAAVMQPDLASLIALAVTLITCIISGFIYMFPFFWFVCGLGIATSDGISLPEQMRIKRRSLAAVNMGQMAPDPNR